MIVVVIIIVMSVFVICLSVDNDTDDKSEDRKILADDSNNVGIAENTAQLEENTAAIQDNIESKVQEFILGLGTMIDFVAENNPVYFGFQEKNEFRYFLLSEIGTFIPNRFKNYRERIMEEIPFTVFMFCKSEGETIRRYVNEYYTRLPVYRSSENKILVLKDYIYKAEGKDNSMEQFNISDDIKFLCAVVPMVKACKNYADKYN